MTKKYTMEERDGKWILLRYGELAGSGLPHPGSFDNAHFEFWQRIENLEKEVIPRLIDGLKQAIECIETMAPDTYQSFELENVMNSKVKQFQEVVAEIEREQNEG